MKLLARLTIYAAALLVVFTARLPDQATAVSALRATAEGHALDPVRSLIVTVLLVGILVEVLRPRSVWH